MRPCFDAACSMGVTRASRLAVLIGSRAALVQAVRQGDSSRRWSRLEASLRAIDD